MISASVVSTERSVRDGRRGVSGSGSHSKPAASVGSSVPRSPMFQQYSLVCGTA